MPSRTAAIAGATGLVGRHLAETLLGDAAVARVVAIVRRPLGRAEAKLDERVVAFDRLDEVKGALGVDAAFCCLGTTIKKAGTREAFRVVDHDYPLAFARAALEAGARRFVVVTAVGANARSGIFYNRVKGELDDALRGLAFPRGVVIVRPSMLLGERAESRIGESIGKVVMWLIGFLLVGPLLKYRAIHAADVARAMARAAWDEGEGVRVIEGKELFALARR